MPASNPPQLFPDPASPDSKFVDAGNDEGLRVFTTEQPCAEPQHTTTSCPSQSDSTTESTTPVHATEPAATYPDSTSPLNDLANQVNAIEIAVPVDQVLETRQKLQYMEERIKALKSNLDARLLAWIEKNGSIEYGTKRIYVATKKDKVCKALRPAVEALLGACGGDFDRFCQALSSNALKQGACNEIMGDALWQEHFAVVEKTELKDGEVKAIKQVVEADTNFIKPKRRSSK